MKRSLDENVNNGKIINFQRQNDNKVQENIIKKTNREEIEELNNVIYDIFEDSVVDIIINIDTKNKEIYINEKYINNEKKDKNRKFKYRDKNLDHFLDDIYDDLIYNDINTLSVYLNKQNIFVDKTEWKKQLLNEMLYIDLLEDEMKKEDELINLLECNLKCLDLNQN